jgi:hypothetical protein
MNMSNYWRMAFKRKGVDVWEQCRKQGIAATGYYVDDKPFFGDCSKISEEEFNAIWRRKGVKATSSQSSVKHVAYHMGDGDIIYAKNGTEIAGKGVVRGGYHYQPGIVKQKDVQWEHYVKVDWDENFKPFTLDLGANQHTVLRLRDKHLIKISKMELNKTTLNENVDEFLEEYEGEQRKAEVSFRKRNQKLIDQKKNISDYRCEACGMSYEEVYGEIGKKYIIAHHKDPIGNRNGASKTTMNDISLLCSNCHVMIHRTNPPLSVEELRNQLNQ